MATENRTALVTGGNRNIGFEIAKGLAKAGLHVVIAARTIEQSQQAADQLSSFGSVSAVQLDVTDPASLARAVQSIQAQRGQLDVLVNNAAVSLPPGGKPGQTNLPSQLDAEELQLIFDANFFGLIRATNAFLPLLRASSHAVIVICSSTRGSLTSPKHLMGRPYLPYSCSKAAVNAAAQQYHKEFQDAGDRILINCVCPAYVFPDSSTPSGYRVGHPSDGAAIAIKMALLDKDGQSGTFEDKDGTVPW